MLEYLRNASEKPIAKFLITILAFSFIGWGVAEWIFGGAVSDTTLVRVGSAKIDVQQFNLEKSREMATLTRDQQRAIYTEAGALQEFQEKILQKLATRQMAENRARDLGFVVSEHRIAREIRSYPEFQQDGQFSSAMFDSVLMNSGYSEADFAGILRGQVLRSMVAGSIDMPMKVPAFVATAQYNARYAQRDIEYVAVQYSDFAAENPTEEQLRTFYAQNPHIVPEVRTISYVLVPAKMDQPDEYEAALTRAQRVEDDIISGESLSAAAQKNDAKYAMIEKISADNKSVSDDILTDALVARAFTLDEGTESELIESKQGFIIIRVDSVVPEHNAEFDSVKGGLVADWQRAEQKKQAYLRANELLVDLNKNGNLDGKIAATVSRTTGAPLDVLNGAFNSDVGTNSIVAADNVFYVLRVVDEKLPAIDTEKMAAMQAELQNTAKREIADDYDAFLKRQYPVKVNEKVYNRFFGK